MSQTFDEYRQSLCNELSKIKDPQNDTAINVDVNDPTDILAVFVNHMATQLTYLDEKIEKYRQALNPFTASGDLLRDVIQYRGITAKPGVPTRTTVRFEGTVGATIPAQTQLTTNDGSKIFVTMSDCTIMIGGQTVEAQCDKVGAIPLANNELTRTVTPIVGVSAVHNNNVVIGSDDESDDDIHARLDMYTSSIGNGALDNLDAQLLNIPGVKSARTYIGKDTSKNLNAGEITSMVSGGDDHAIAQTIFDNNMFLLNTKGNVSASVTSKLHKVQYTINFSRPSNLEIDNITVYIPSNDDTYLDTLYQASISFFDLLAPGSVFFVSKYLNYLDAQTDIPIVDVDVTIGRKNIRTYPLSWDQVLRINKNNFNLEHYNA